MSKLRELVHDTPMRPPSPVDEELKAFLQSIPPPPMSPARDRVAMRPRSNSDLFDIEELQREARDAVARWAAEQVAKANAEKLAAQARTREKWIDLARGVIGHVFEWAMIAFLTWLSVTLWSRR